MKIIHCADLHLDSKIDIKDKMKSSLRKEEILCTFERLCDYAKQNSVTAIIIAGDLFDGVKVSKKVFERVVAIIKNCCDIDFLYLFGNHDGGANIDFSYFPSNFKVFKNEFTCFNYGKVSIGGISYLNSLSIADYENINFDSDNFNILALHGQIADYKGAPKNDVISLPRLKDRNINYLALGHYHSFMEGDIDINGKYVYSGCIEGRGFDETGDKGFVLIDTNNMQNPYSFIKFCTRTIHVVEYNLTPFDCWSVACSEIYRDLTSKIPSESMLKVELVGECKTDFYLDPNQLSLRLNQAFFYAKVEDKTTLAISEMDYINDKTVRGEFISLVWNSDLSSEDKKRIITCGLNALSGDEII